MPDVAESDCGGLALLVTGLENLLAAPRGAGGAAGGAAAVLMLYAMFGGLWSDPADYDAFSAGFSADLCGEITRGKPRTKQSSVVRTALSPLELVCKFVYGPAAAANRARP